MTALPDDISAEIARIDAMNDGPEAFPAFVALLQRTPPALRPFVDVALRYVATTVVTGALNADGNMTYYVNGVPVVDTLGYELIGDLPDGITQDAIDAACNRGDDATVQSLIGQLQGWPTAAAEDAYRALDVRIHGD